MFRSRPVVPEFLTLEQAQIRGPIRDNFRAETFSISHGPNLAEVLAHLQPGFISPLRFTGTWSDLPILYQDGEDSTIRVLIIGVANDLGLVGKFEEDNPANWSGSLNVGGLFVPVEPLEADSKGHQDGYYLEGQAGQRPGSTDYDLQWEYFYAYKVALEPNVARLIAAHVPSTTKPPR